MIKQIVMGVVFIFSYVLVMMLTVGFLFRVRIKEIIAGLLKSRKAYESLNLLRKLSWRDFIESQLRAESGEILSRPFGSPVHYFDLHQIQFNSGYLSLRSLENSVEVETSVVLGPRAKKPVHLEIPIIFGAMSYGNSFSIPTELSLGRAADLSGTIINSGNGPFLEVVRESIKRFTLQLPRASWSREAEIWQQVEMIELGLGHSAWASAPIRIKGYKVIPDFARRIGHIPGLDLLIDARLAEIDRKGLAGFVKELKAVSGGVPIAVKFGGSHYLEKELEIMVEGGIDVIVFDGIEAGTHGSPPLFQDHTGLPFFPGLCRAVRFFEKNQLKSRVSLVAGGGLTAPGDFLKCLALGADAVLIGTIAALLITHTQVTKSIPWEPPTELLYFGGKHVKKFNPELGGEHLHYYLKGCVEEMKALARVLGKDDLKKLTRTDLVALDPLYAEMAGIPYQRKTSG